MLEFGILIYLSAQVLAAITEILLKVSANKPHTTLLKEYVNLTVFLAYFLYAPTILIHIYAYKFIPISLGVILGSTAYILVPLLGRVVLKEKISRMKLFGMAVIVAGIIVFNL